MLIRTENLTLTYADNQDVVYAVREVSFSLPESGLHTIIGPSGSGKTSLLYLLSGIKPASSGMVFYNDTALPGTTTELNLLRRTKMGFVFQMHFLIPYLTVLENVLVGALRENTGAEKRARELLKTLGLKGLEHRKPAQLSGGQRQRVAIARAFVHSPEIVFVDEPTASLDQESGHKVLELLETFAKEACVVVVTHDERILKHSDSAFKMRDGSLSPISS